MSVFTEADLAALEKRRRRTGRTVGSAKDDDGRKERAIQREIVRAVRQMGFRAVHVPNGGSLAGDEQARMRQGVARRMDGCVTGFPDLLLMRPGTGEVVFLEIKRPGGRLSDAQDACIAHMRNDGFRVGTASKLDDAIYWLKKWKWIE